MQEDQIEETMRLNLPNEWQCRIAPSLGGGFAGTPNEVWGTVDYTDKDKPCVFFGMYGLNDFVAFQQHRGEKAVFWAGTDILHFINGYWIDREGFIRVNPMPFAQYFKGFQNYTENRVEANNLLKFGIHSNIVPSFLGNVNDYPVSFRYSEKPKVYASVSGDNFKVYGWDVIERIAPYVPEVEFHLYGNNREWKTKNPNVIVHGRLSQEQMNSEIKEMACGFRPLEHDGCSEIMVKSILWGQYPIVRIKYPYVDSYETDEELIDFLSNLKDKKEPNLKTREIYLKQLNNFIWNNKKI